MIKFEVVRDDARKTISPSPTQYMDNKIEIDGKKMYVPEITLPTRADGGSAGYDFYAPYDVQILPAQKTILFTDIKAKMPKDVVLQIFIRSSMAIKQGLMLTNNVGIIDSTYYGNESNDGNIGIPLVNTTGKAVNIKAGERVAQGIFINYLTVDGEKINDNIRIGGMGSSGK